MKFDPVEKVLRLGGGIATVVTLSTIVQGLLKSSRREVAAEGSQMLALLHKPWVIAGASVAALGILGALWRPLPLRLPALCRAVITLSGAAMFFAGIGLFHWGRRTMGEMYDLSTSQGTRLYADHRLVTSGPFAYVRHPLYVAGILAEVGALLMYRTWTTAMIALNALSLIKRAAVEEEALAARFGDEWSAYARRVPRWLPRRGLCCTGRLPEETIEEL